MKVYIDFEYNSTREEKLNVVCCSLQVEGGHLENYWLHDGSNRLSFLGRIEGLKDHIFVAYNVVAEAGAFLSLGLNPLDYKWIDLYLEYRQLLNHNHKLMYGKQLIQGRKKTTKPPPANKWDITEEQKKILDMSKPEFNLASACYKLLEVEIDTVFKDDTRQLIISAPKRFTDEQRATILEYCASDIKYLPELLKAMVREYRELFRREPELLSSLKAEMLLRAEYSCRTAIIERKGYPIDLEATRAFSDSVPSLLFELQTEINLLFPTIRPFELDKKYNYTWKQERTREWVRAHVKRTGASWRQTDKGSLSLSLDAFKDHFNYSHNYPKDNFGAQMVRYLSFKQQLNGFSPTSKNSFWDYVGSDDRARAYFGIYGSQSSRSQPKATGFLFLKSAWMRALCVPPKGRMMVGIDFGSQEFLLGALISGDENMRKAYESGDPYLYFAKLAGAVPWDGTKDEYKTQRNLFKSTCIAEGTLIRVKGWGYKPIERITSTDEVWDGEAWRKSEGSKLMGVKPTLLVEGVSATREHRILTNTGWVENEFTEKERREGKVYYKDARRLQRASASWSEVWRLASSFLRSEIARQSQKITSISKRWNS